MKLQVLGKGCSKCHELEENAKQALEDAEDDVELETVYDITEASAMGMMDAPGLAIDGDIKIQGRVPDVDEIAPLVQQ
jgi:small redox-active disulfide protein 2